MTGEACQRTTKEREEESSDLGDLFEKYDTSLYDIALSKVGNRDEARDIVSDSWLNLAKKLDENPHYIKESRGSLYSFLRRIVINKLFDRYRFESRRRVDSFHKEDIQGCSRGEVDLKDIRWRNGSDVEFSRSADVLLSGKENVDAIKRVISKMPSKYGDVLFYLVQGIDDNKSLARIFHLTDATMRWRVHKARDIFGVQYERARRLGEI
jgi:DNA-directed RNA polymerase specialized sigma24 family protein